MEAVGDLEFCERNWRRRTIHTHVRRAMLHVRQLSKPTCLTCRNALRVVHVYSLPAPGSQSARRADGSRALNWSVYSAATAQITHFVPVTRPRRTLSGAAAVSRVVHAVR